MFGERSQQSTDNAKNSEKDAAPRWGAGFFLVAVGQLRLDPLALFQPPQQANEGRVEDERDRERDHKREHVEDHLVSSFTTSSSPALCDALINTRSPRRALFLTQVTAASLSGTR